MRDGRCQGAAARAILPGRQAGKCLPGDSRQAPLRYLAMTRVAGGAGWNETVPNPALTSQSR